MSEQVEGQLTLFPEGSPASRSLLPGSREARKMTATSGRKWLGLSKNSGPLGLLEKMLLESLEWHSPIFYMNWKPVGIGQGHFLFQLALSEPDTEDTGSRLWATPNTMDHLPQRSLEALKRQAEGSRKGRKRPANLREQVNPETVKMWEEPKIWKTPVAADAANREMYVNSRGEPNLSGQVKMWPTPKASLRGDCPSERNRKSPDLSAAVKMWATPTAQDYKRRGPNSRQQGLPEQARMHNTPTAQDAKNSTLPPSQIKRGSLVGDVMREQTEHQTGQLNPSWTEWLMGFPIGWTEI